jgi:dihydroorotase
MKLVDLMSTRPAKIVKLDRGSLKIGAVADVTVIDPQKTWTIDVQKFQSKSRNCPFHGWNVRGRARATIVGGDMKYELTQP